MSIKSEEDKPALLSKLTEHTRIPKLSNDLKSNC